MVSIPVGDSDFFFVPHSRHAEYSIFSYFFSELKIHHLSLFNFFLFHLQKNAVVVESVLLRATLPLIHTNAIMLLTDLVTRYYVFIYFNGVS